MPGRGDRGREKQKPKDAKKTLRRIINYLSEYVWIVVLFAILAFLSNIGNLMGPRLAGLAIGATEAGAGSVDMDLVIHYAILMLVFYVGSNLLSFLVSIGMTRVGRRIAQNMRRDVFGKLMKLPVGFFDRNQAGDIISSVS